MTLHKGDALEILPTLRRSSVQLIATSPPYNCGWDYAGRDDDRMPLSEYLAFLTTAIKECHRVLRRGGVLVLNLPQTIQVYDTQADGTQYRPDPSLPKMGRKRKPPKPNKRAWPIYAWAALHIATSGDWLPREPIVWLKSKGDVEVRATSTAIGAYSNRQLSVPTRIPGCAPPMKCSSWRPKATTGSPSALVAGLAITTLSGRT